MYTIYHRHQECLCLSSCEQYKRATFSLHCIHSLISYKTKIPLDDQVLFPFSGKIFYQGLFKNLFTPYTVFFFPN